MRISFEGDLDKLHRRLKDNVTMDDVKRVVRYNGTQLHSKMNKKADFRGHIGWKSGVGKTMISPTGETKRSIHLELKDSGYTAEVGPTTHYSKYLEYGTRFMDAQPFIKPAFDEQKEKFKKDMDRLVK